MSTGAHLDAASSGDGHSQWNANISLPRWQLGLGLSGFLGIGVALGYLGFSRSEKPGSGTQAVVRPDLIFGAAIDPKAARLQPRAVFADADIVRRLRKALASTPKELLPAGAAESLNNFEKRPGVFLHGVFHRYEQFIVRMLRDDAAHAAVMSAFDRLLISNPHQAAAILTDLPHETQKILTAGEVAGLIGRAADQGGFWERSVIRLWQNRPELFPDSLADSFRFRNVRGRMLRGDYSDFAEGSYLSGMPVVYMNNACERGIDDLRFLTALAAKGISRRYEPAKTWEHHLNRPHREYWLDLGIERLLRREKSVLYPASEITRNEKQDPVLLSGFLAALQKFDSGKFSKLIRSLPEKAPDLAIEILADYAYWSVIPRDSLLMLLRDMAEQKPAIFLRDYNKIPIVDFYPEINSRALMRTAIKKGGLMLPCLLPDMHTEKDGVRLVFQYVPSPYREQLTAESAKPWEQRDHVRLKAIADGIPDLPQRR